MIIYNEVRIYCDKCGKRFRMAVDCLKERKHYYTIQMKKELQKTLKIHLNECKE